MNTEKNTTAATTETTTATEVVKKVKAAKVLTPSDKIALRIVEGIRENRDAWIKSESKDEAGAKVSFESTMGTAKVSVSRLEVPGKKSKEVIARSSITITPEVGKPLTITGPLAARAWMAMTHTPAIRGKAEIDDEAVNAAAEALGL